MAEKVWIPGVARIDMKMSADDMEGGAREVITSIRPTWRKEDVIFTVYTAGITNRLIGCHHRDDPEQKDAILVRMYGENTELIVDRNMEMVVMYMLSKVGCCKPLYAQLTNGISYGFVPGSCLTVQSVRDPHIGRLVAEEIARYHVIDPLDVIGDLGTEGLKFFKKEEPRKFIKLHKYLHEATEVYDDPEKTERYSREFPSLSTLKKEALELETHISALNCPIVFCHNDLLLNNIVYNDKEDRCYFIDFEYSCINYQAAELSAFFCEWAGVSDKEIDYSAYPDKPTQVIWLRHYLRALKTKQGQTNREPTEQEVETLYVQVNQMSLVQHLSMAGWSLVQAKHSGLDFDYFGFAKARLDQYFRTKEEFLALKLPDASQSL